MKEIVTYLSFDGNCRQAMTFYAEALGGTLSIMDMGENSPAGPAAKDRVMHSHLKFPTATLMASDLMPGMSGGFYPGNNFSISIDCDTAEEEDKYFTALAAGGAITMPLQDTFWGARFGMVRDKFGVTWMFNLDQSQAHA